MLLATANKAKSLYRVVEVGGRRPTQLTDFIGADTVIIVVDGEPQRLIGMGGMTAGGMEFEQHDPAGMDQPNVQVWVIIEDGDGKFWVERASSSI